MPQPKFALGRVVATPGAIQALEDAGQDALHFVCMHEEGSWGDLCPEDRKVNDEAIAHEGDPNSQSRVVSSYETKLGTKIWVITEWDR